MRTLTQKEMDDKMLESISRQIHTSLIDYIKLRQEIFDRKSITGETKYERDVIKIFESAKQMLTENSADPSYTIEHLLCLQQKKDPKQLKDGKCPNCAADFPADLWAWHDTLFCPYCGQRVNSPLSFGGEPVEVFLSEAVP